jgi:hypothetical protein
MVLSCSIFRFIINVYNSLKFKPAFFNSLDKTVIAELPMPCNECISSAEYFVKSPTLVILTFTSALLAGAANKESKPPLGLLVAAHFGHTRQLLVFIN